MPKIKPRSSRRAPPLKDSDYDHEIILVDRADELRPERTRSNESEAGPSVRPSTTEPLVRGESSSSQPAVHDTDEPEAQQQTNLDPDSPDRGKQPVVALQQPTPLEHPGSRNGTRKKRTSRQEQESAIDILYENERGGFLCGVALFSGKALGNLDPPPWTNFAHRPSPTSISTAQVPDPSWAWAWPEWRVNHDEGTDEGGWEYSFMFAKKFSWHGPRWYNSFVRRRAWIRKRVKKAVDLSEGDPHLLNPEYFTVQTAAETRRSASSRASSHVPSKASISQTSNAETDMEEERPDIEYVETLLRVLRGARIDREKIEAVDNFLEHGQDDFVHLQEEMHDIMSLFVFQASRKILLTRLTQAYDEAVEKKSKEDTDTQRELVTNLAAAVKHADEEVRKLEYWSDIKTMAETGASKGAIDEQQGWDKAQWTGLDKSGPAEPEAPLHQDK